MAVIELIPQFSLAPENMEEQIVLFLFHFILNLSFLLTDLTSYKLDCFFSSVLFREIVLVLVFTQELDVGPLKACEQLQVFLLVIMWQVQIIADVLVGCLRYLSLDVLGLIRFFIFVHDGILLRHFKYLM